MAKTVRLSVNTRDIARAERASAARGLALGAEHVLQEARAEVPIEEGTLERSGVASVDQASLQAAVSFDTPYAVRQHEDMGLRHDQGRKAKYLEDPLLGARDTVAQIVAREVRKGLG